MKFSQAASAAALAAALATPASGLPNCAGDCCAALQKAGLTHVLTPGSEAYKERTLTYWSITSQLAPWCIVSPPIMQI
ncbi:hypothetical protein PG985_014181 [Apiospora marii]|uniref:uncharacterized protein n=1 Tax=Apiospora marii TaxID=335849 RepID=UPI0031313426